MAKEQYRVLVGMNYPPNDKRAEPGDVVDDIPPASAAWMLRDGAIEKVGPQRKATSAKAEGKGG